MVRRARTKRCTSPIDPTIGDPGRSTTPAWRHLPALESGGRVSGVIDDGEDLSNFRGVQLSGKAEKVEQADLKEELLDLALEKYFYIGHPHLEHYLSRGMIEARSWYRLVPERVVGWDRRQLPQPPVMDRRTLPPFLLKAKVNPREHRPSAFDCILWPTARTLPISSVTPIASSRPSIRCIRRAPSIFPATSNRAAGYFRRRCSWGCRRSCVNT